MTYLTHDIPVAGGLLRVGEWRADDTSETAAPSHATERSHAAAPPRPVGQAPIIVALHGMTGSHLSWQFLTAAMPEARIIAPDLRGRGRSAELPAPYGIAQHVADLHAVVRALRLDSVGDSGRMAIVGHSLGAFVALAALSSVPDVFGSALFVDGGLPLTVPLSIDDDDLVEAVLGVAVARRTELTFTSTAIYRKFWQLHPGLAVAWSDELGLMADYDLAEILAADGRLQYRPVARRDAIEADARELFGSHAVREQLSRLGERAEIARVMNPRGEFAAPDARASAYTLMTAGRGLLNETPGVYNVAELSRSKEEYPFLSFVEMSDMNHYSLVLSAKGASAIAVELRRMLARS